MKISEFLALETTKTGRIFDTNTTPRRGGGRGGGGGQVSPRKSVVQLACKYDVTSRVSDFQNGEQSVHRRDR